MKQYHANGIKFVERDNTLFAEISQFGVTTIYPIKKPKKNTQIKYILMDLDGTVYFGSKLIPGANEAIEFFRNNGKKIYFTTN